MTRNEFYKRINWKARIGEGGGGGGGGGRLSWAKWRTGRVMKTFLSCFLYIFHAETIPISDEKMKV